MHCQPRRGFTDSNLVDELNACGITDIPHRHLLADHAKIFNLYRARFTSYLDKQQFRRASKDKVLGIARVE